MLMSPKASKKAMAIDKPILIKTMHCDSCLVSSREEILKESVAHITYKKGQYIFTWWAVDLYIYI